MNIKRTKTDHKIKNFSVSFEILVYAMPRRRNLTDGEKLVRANKKACLSNLCKIIYDKVSSNGGEMPYRYMANLVKDHQKDFRWLTKDMVNSAYTRYKKKRRLEENSA